MHQLHTKDEPTGIKTPQQIAQELSDLTGLDERYIRRLYVRPLIMKRVSLKTAKGNIANFFVFLWQVTRMVWLV